MKALLKGFEVTELDARAYVPADQEHFSLLFVLEVGCEGSDGADLFYLTVCTPKAFASEMSPDSICSGHSIIFVNTYDYDAIYAFVKRYVEESTGATWDTVAARINRLAIWEYQDTGRSDVSLHLHHPDADSALR